MDSFEEDRFAEEESNDNVKPYQDVDDDVKPSQDVDDDDYKPQRNTTDIEDEGKLFVGGLRRDTTSVEFVKHFEKYGEITDSVIMKDKDTGMPRGFGFVTFADSSVTDKVLQDAHILSGRKVDVKRALPQGSENSDEFKTKKIFVGGIPSSVDDDEFKEFFMQFGEVKDHLIIRDHTSGKSRGFGFITYESKEMVDLLLAKGNRIELGGTLVELKKAEPKKPNSASLPSRRSGDSRSSFSGDSYGGGYGGSGGPYMSTGGYGSGRSGGYEGEFGGYGGGYGSGVGPYRGEPASGYGGGGSGYNSGGYGMGGNSGGYGGGPGDMSGGPYGEPGGGYSEPSASYGGGPYGEPGGGYSGPSASYGGGPGDMNGGPYGEPGGSYGGPSASYGGGYGTGGSGLGGYGGTGNEGYNRGGGRYDGGRRGGGDGSGGGGGESRGHGSSSRYQPYGR